jgi:hypothetical protein
MLMKTELYWQKTSESLPILHISCCGDFEEESDSVLMLTDGVKSLGRLVNDIFSGLGPHWESGSYEGWKISPPTYWAYITVPKPY